MSCGFILDAPCRRRKRCCWRLKNHPSTSPRFPNRSARAQQEELMLLAFLEQGAEEKQKALLNHLQSAYRALVAYEDSLPTTMIMRDLPEGRPSFIRLRGVYDALGESVEPGVPNVFPPLPRGDKNNRLAFARWLVSPQHPLTARVSVNRYWQLLFGRGFVKTPEDFGAQGDPPSHPQLLDWLAADFIETDWDVKSLIKTIVMSATYRQASTVCEEHLRKDPDNVLLARAPTLAIGGERAPRSSADGLRSARRATWWTVGLSVPTGRLVGRSEQLQIQTWRGSGPLSTQSVHLLETNARPAHDGGARHGRS